MIYYLLALFVVAVDQLTKWLIVQRLSLHESMSVIGEFFQITSHRNRGAAFGILQNKQWFFLIITVIVVIGILIYLRNVMRAGRKLLAVALSLVLGGAIGNFIDRAMNGEVVDFFQFHFEFSLFGYPVDYIFPIFNVADSAIVVGVALILLDTLLDWLKEKRGQTNGFYGS